MMNHHDLVTGTNADDTLVLSGHGQAIAGRGNDILDLTPGTGFADNGLPQQIHAWGDEGDDVLRMHMPESQDDGVFFGHHVRGDREGELGENVELGRDVFDFVGLSALQEGQVVVGRIDDYDHSRDEIRVEGVRIDLNALPENIRLVEFNGTHDIHERSEPQMWLLITTEQGGKVFYSLDGARIDADDTNPGFANLGTEEAHFIPESLLPDFDSLQDVRFVDRQNYIPAGYEQQDGGLYINDFDGNNGRFHMLDNPSGRSVRENVDDPVYGGNGNDLIAGGVNNDVIIALDGADTIWGGSGYDTVRAGEGDDVVYSGTGNDVVYGERGNDSLYGEDGNDDIDGGSGDDLIVGGSGHDSLLGGTGNDIIFGGHGDDTVRGGIGNDILNGDVGADLISGETGNDAIYGGNGDDTLNGGNGDDTIFGNVDNDYIGGGQGNDLLDGGWGNDTINGEDGDDTIIGFAGDDSLLGGGGADRINGNVGNDTIDGGDGSDTLDGGWGNDLLSGAGDHDLLIGWAGNDTLLGGWGADSLLGGEGNDILDGGDGGDSLLGGSGNDVLSGDWGSDTLVGGEGADTLAGGGLRDVLIGGSGRDVFQISQSWHSLVGADTRDTITDFERGLDQIDLQQIDASWWRSDNQDFIFAGMQQGANVLWYEVEEGFLLVRGDMSGDGIADFEFEVHGVDELSEADFIL